MAMKDMAFNHKVATQEESGNKDAPSYHHTVHLDKHDVKKLMGGNVPKVGSTLKLHAHGYVRQMSSDKDGHSVTIELRKMDVKHGEAGPQSQEALNKGARAEMDKVLSKSTKVTKKGGYHDGATDGPVEDSER